MIIADIMNANFPWFDVSVLAVVAALLTWFIIYCAKREKTSFRIPWLLPWVHKSENPVLFKLEMRAYIFLDVMLVVLIVARVVLNRWGMG